MQLYKYEGKNKEELLEKVLKELEVKETDIIIIEKEIEGKLFKAKKIELTVIKKDDIKKELKKFIKDLSTRMNIEIHSEISEIDNIFNILLVSENNSILIGKDGRTMNSIQLLLRQYVHKNIGNIVKINIDVSNYKAKKLKNNEYEIKKIARDVSKTKIEAKLDPMNSYERRIVHTVISEFPDLITESVGEEPDRYVIIKYKEN